MYRRPNHVASAVPVSSASCAVVTWTFLRHVFCTLMAVTRARAETTVPSGTPYRPSSVRSSRRSS